MKTSASVTPGTDYMFDNATEEAARQLHHLGQILDPTTRTVLTDAGLGPHWRVADIGAGGGTLTTWLLDQVGPSGHVTAVDVDPRHIVPAANLTILQGDIRTMSLPEESQHAIVARLLLMHLPEREQVLAQFVQALRPGGVLVIADWDCNWRNMIRRSPGPRATTLLNRFQDALLGYGESKGADMGWAGRVLDTMIGLGLTEVTSHIDSRSWQGGTGICLLHRSNSLQRQDELIAAGMSLDELAELRDVLMDPNLWLSGYLMHTTVGYRPTVRPLD